MQDTDEYYQDMLDGLSRYLDHPLLRDVLHTVRRCPVPDLGNALNKNQIQGKKWLLEELYHAFGGDLGTVYVLGGWYGVLGAMLLHDPRFARTTSVVSFDLNPECRIVAGHLNRFHIEAGRFHAVTKDMLHINYIGHPESQDAGGFPTGPDLIINTSCEHLPDFDAWYRTLPAGVRLVLQSNDYYALDEHVNCVPDVDAFKRQAPMSELKFGGVLPLKRYRRFMLIGVR